jgi:hypothetical protein
MTAWDDDAGAGAGAGADTGDDVEVEAVGGTKKECCCGSVGVD